MSWAIIAHSQKGSEWKDHEYIKREGTDGKLEDNGVYYYPDDYKGGRHLPKGDKNRNKVKYDSEAYKKRGFGNGDRTSMEEWERKVHEHVDKIIASNPEMFKSGADVARGIMNESNLNAVKNTLKAMGVSTDSMSDDEIKQLRSKIASYYDSGAGASSGKSSGKKSSKSQDSSDSKEEKKEESNPTGRMNKEQREKYNKILGKKKGKTYTNRMPHSAIFELDDNFLEHHGILGMRWGKRNGPPYPLGASDHSASEKKAGWRKSLFGGKTKEEKGRRKSSGGSSRTSDSGIDAEIKKMSDAELNQRLNRLRNEQQYKDLLSGRSNNNQNKGNKNDQSSNKNSYDMTWSKNMTDKEAADYVKRLKNEKSYEELSQRDITQGSRFVKGLLITAGTVAATTLVTTIAVQAGKNGANSILKKMAKSED